MTLEKKIADLERQIAYLKKQVEEPQYYDFSGCGGEGDFNTRPNEMFGCYDEPFAYICKAMRPPGIERGHAIKLSEKYNWKIMNHEYEDYQFLVGIKITF